MNKSDLADFSTWWESEGRHADARGMDYEKMYAYEAWKYMQNIALEQAALICEKSPGLSADEYAAKIRALNPSKKRASPEAA